LNSEKKPCVWIVTISDLRYEANLFRKAQTLAKKGFDVRILAAYHEELDLSIWQGVSVTRLKLPVKPTFWRFLVFVVKSFFKLVPQKADLFIAYDYLPLLPLRMKYVLSPIVYVYDSVELLFGLNSLVGRPWRHRFWHWYERLGLQKCRGAFTVCRSDARALQKLYPSLKVYGYVRNIPEYRPLTPSNFLRRSYGIPADHKIAIYQGMLFEGRGLREILAACRQVDKVTLVFVGDGPLLNELKRLAREYGMESRVIFTGLLLFQDLQKYTAGADFGFTVISGKGLSYYHALPNKLFEYIQAEIPVIGSNYPEIAAIIESEKIGLTVNPTNISEIRQAVRQMSEQNNYDKFKIRLKKVAQKYTWQKEEKEYLRIIRSALAEKS